MARTRAGGAGAAAMGPRDGGAPAGRAAWSRGDVAACAGLVVVAFLVRVAGAVAFEGLAAPPNASAFYDGVEFEQIARHLVEEGRFARDEGGLTSFRAPGFPFLLAAVYAVAGPGNHVAAHIAFCLVGALVVLPTYVLGRLLAGPAVAVLSGALVAVLPGVAYYSIHFSSEPLHTLALVSATALLAAAAARGRAELLLAGGVALGVAALVRPVALYFLPLFAVALAFCYPGRRARAALLLALGALLVVLPWTLRNWRAHDRWLLIASNGGSTFWGSNNDVVARDPKLRGEWISTRLLRGADSPIDRLPNEVDRDRAEFAEGKAW
ncbi:MAG TPA: glycosyltransferase family 39 protein, partial [Gemmatimonadaceae bacterium]|nr:glycosyltransferase family 39 protein [Gemmatimonadaceae bacterium]